MCAPHGLARAPAAGAIAWHPCAPDSPPTLECGEITVPLECVRPGGPTVAERGDARFLSSQLRRDGLDLAGLAV